MLSKRTVKMYWFETEVAARLALAHFRSDFGFGSCLRYGNELRLSGTEDQHQVMESLMAEALDRGPYRPEDDLQTQLTATCAEFGLSTEGL